MVGMNLLLLTQLDGALRRPLEALGSLTTC
jgi:hypothetical protein